MVYMENSHFSNPAGDQTLKPVAVALVVMFSKLNWAVWQNTGTTIINIHLVSLDHMSNCKDKRDTFQFYRKNSGFC